MNEKENYLKSELYDFVQHDSSIFEFLQSGSLDEIWYWDIENPENEWMSPRFWEILGFDPSEKQHLAKEWQDIINQDDLKVALSNFEKHCINSDNPYDQIVRYRHKDGSTVWVRCRGIAIRDKTGKPIRLLGAHTDLTQLNQTESKLRERTAELEEANKKLNEALNKIQSLEDFTPFCIYCKKIRDHRGFWEEVEASGGAQAQGNFAQGICPTCKDEIMGDMDN